MPKPPNRSAASALEQVYVRDRGAWRAWLASNHAASRGIWLVFDKKASRADRLLYGDAVEEALCFGWIDSIVRTLDDAQYLQMFTPRKPAGTWSRSNKERVERLIAQGLMAEPGLAAIETAKRNGAWSSLDAVEAMIVPDDLAAALAASKGAAENFAGFSPTTRKGFLGWIRQAARPETRASRVAYVAQRAAANDGTRQVATPVAAPPVKPAAKHAKPTKATTTKSAKPAKASTPTSKAARTKRSSTTRRAATRTSAPRKRSR